MTGIPTPLSGAAKPAILRSTPVCAENYLPPNIRHGPYDPGDIDEQQQIKISLGRIANFYLAERPRLKRFIGLRQVLEGIATTS